MQCEPRIIEGVSVGEEGIEKQHISTSFNAASFPFSSFPSSVENSHDYGLLEMAPNCKEIVLIVGDEEGAEEVEKTALLDNSTPLTSSFSSPSSSPSCAVNEGANLALHKGVGKVILTVDKSVEEIPKRANTPTVSQPYRFNRMEESALSVEDSSSNVLSSPSCPLSASPSTFSLPLSRALFPSSPLTHPTPSASTVPATPSQPSSHHTVHTPSTLFSASHKAVRYCNAWNEEKENTGGALTPCGVCETAPFASTSLRRKDVPWTTPAPSSSTSGVVSPVGVWRSSLRYGWGGASSYPMAHCPSSPSPSKSRATERDKGHSPPLARSVSAVPSFPVSGAPVEWPTPPTTLSSSGDGSGREVWRKACGDTLPLAAACREDLTHGTHGMADEKKTGREGRQRRPFSVSLPASSFSPAFRHHDKVHFLPLDPLRHGDRAVARSARGRQESPFSPSPLPSLSDASKATVVGTPHAFAPSTTERQPAHDVAQEACEGVAQVEIAPGHVIFIPLLPGDHLPSLAAAFLQEHDVSPTFQVELENFLVEQRRRWRRQRSAAASFSSPTSLLDNETNVNGMGRNGTRAMSRSGAVGTAHHPVDGGKESVEPPKRNTNATFARRDKSPIGPPHASAPPPRAMASGRRSSSVCSGRDERAERLHTGKTPMVPVPLARPTRTTVLRQQYGRQQREHDGERHRPDAPKRVRFSPRHARERRSGRLRFSLDASQLSLSVPLGMETTEKKGAVSVPSLPFSSPFRFDDESKKKKEKKKHIDTTSSSPTGVAERLPSSNRAAASPAERVSLGAFPAAWTSRDETAGMETAKVNEEKENGKWRPEVAAYQRRGGGIPKDIRSTEERELQEKCTFRPKINRYRAGHGRGSPSSVARKDESRPSDEEPPPWETSGREEWRIQRTARHARFSPPRERSDHRRAGANAARHESGQSSTKPDSSAFTKEDRSGRLPPALSDRVDPPQSRAIGIPAQHSPTFPSSGAFTPSSFSSCQTKEGVRYDGRDVPSSFSFSCTTRFPPHFSVVPLTDSPSVSDAPPKHATAERRTTMFSHRSSGRRSTGKENGVHSRNEDLMKRFDSTNPDVNFALRCSPARTSFSLRNEKERSSGIPATPSMAASSSSARYCFSSAKRNPIVSTSSPTLASVAEIKEKIASLSHQWKKREDFLGLVSSQ